MRFVEDEIGSEVVDDRVLDRLPDVQASASGGASVLNRFGLDVDVAFDVPAGEERRAGQLYAREPLSRG